MTATYLGSFTVGDSVPGIAAVLEQVGTTLQELRDTCEDQLPLLAALDACIGVQAGAILDAQTAIRVPAVSDFEFQLNAAIDLAAGFQLQLADPSSYLTGLLSGLSEVQANLGALPVPSIALDTQIAAANANAAAMQGKIDAVDLELGALAGISAHLGTCTAVNLAPVRTALQNAIDATAAAINAYIAMAAHLAVAGARCVLFDGPLEDLGTEVDAAAAGAGVAGVTEVYGPVIFVVKSDLAAKNAVDAVFRTS